LFQTRDQGYGKASAESGLPRLGVQAISKVGVKVLHVACLQEIVDLGHGHVQLKREIIRSNHFFSVTELMPPPQAQEIRSFTVGLSQYSPISWSQEIEISMSNETTVRLFVISMLTI
jgi:hypothetical protein